MGEYLSPGVYSEFIEPIAPIEPVSTSTAAMIGVSERGPENVPILVGAPGELSAGSVRSCRSTTIAIRSMRAARIAICPIPSRAFSPMAASGSMPCA